VHCALGANGNPGGMSNAIQKQVRRGFVKALSSIQSLCLVYCALGAIGIPGGVGSAVHRQVRRGLWKLCLQY
jgi:hypothetical protein